VTYPPADGSSYPTGRGGANSKKNVADYGAESEDQDRSYGLPDKWTAAMLDELNNGQPITTKQV
jgi:hypothetical protein